ncbi:MAG TPA: hypothetical protein EYP10_08865, partial [Armatimonadetes bacterium]|nr:hypothetical protein [Armatimonadota bacterium]
MIYQRDCPVQCLNRMMINLVIVAIAMLPCIPLKSITGWHANGVAIAAQQITAKEALEWASQEAGIKYSDVDFLTLSARTEVFPF